MCVVSWRALLHPGAEPGHIHAVQKLAKVRVDVLYNPKRHISQSDIHLGLKLCMHAKWSFGMAVLGDKSISFVILGPFQSTYVGVLYETIPPYHHGGTIRTLPLSIGVYPYQVPRKSMALLWSGHIQVGSSYAMVVLWTMAAIVDVSTCLILVPPMSAR